MEHTKTPWTIKEALFHDLETGKPIGTEYWILDKNGEEIACNENEHIARRIVAAVNAVERIETEWLEKHKLTFTGETIDKIQELKTQNARLLEALKNILDFNLETDGATYDWEELVTTVKKARAAIAEAEKTNQPEK